MAEIVTGFQNWNRNSKIATKYPWDDWFDGQQWKLDQNDLHNMPFDDLARYAHKKAAEAGIKVKTKRIQKDHTTGKYLYMIIEATCPRCKHIHSDRTGTKMTEKVKSCFLNGFSPNYESKGFTRDRKKYLAGIPRGFGYRLVAEPQEEGENA